MGMSTYFYVLYSADQVSLFNIINSSLYGFRYRLGTS